MHLSKFLAVSRLAAVKALALSVLAAAMVSWAPAAPA